MLPQAYLQQIESRTIQTAIDNTKDKDDLTTPGHIFPLVAKKWRCAYLGQDIQKLL